MRMLHSAESKHLTATLELLRRKTFCENVGNHLARRNILDLDQAFRYQVGVMTLTADRLRRCLLTFIQLTLAMTSQSLLYPVALAYFLLSLCLLFRAAFLASVFGRYSG